MRVGVVGLGYVGLPLARALRGAGHEVVGVDVFDGPVAEASQRLGIEASSDYAIVAGADAVVICVPTPLTAHREPDLAPLRACGRALAPHVEHGMLVVLESTTFPGTTREELRPLLEAGGLVAGEDFHLAYSPERIDPGPGGRDIATTPKLVGGLTPACGDRAEELFAGVSGGVVRVGSPEVAEFTKLLENIFRSVNIALVNELAMVADRMGIDIWEAVDAAATKPYGFMSFEPGPGMGGHCLPVDPFYLAWRARAFDVPTEFIELAGKVNQQMPYHCVMRVERMLNDAGRPVRGTRVLLLGVAYKPGIDDVRESPALKILELLRERGAQLRYHDPHVAELPDAGLRSTPLAEALAWADATVLVTAHAETDLGHVLAGSELLLDLRGATRALDVPGAATAVRL